MVNDKYRAQKQHRLAWMPWMYFQLGPADRAWAERWQKRVHAELAELEDIKIDPTAFVAPGAHIFAEPGRTIRIGARGAIGAECFVHGPVDVGPDCGLNPQVKLDGGRAGIVLGRGVRVASGVKMYAFDHGMAPGQPIREQKVRSRGIRIGDDVWIGAGAGITDGVTVGEGAVVGMGAVVTRNVAPGTKVGGVPAVVLGQRGPSSERLPSGRSTG